MANSVVVKIDGDDSGFNKSLSGIGAAAKKGLGIAVKGVTAVSAAFAGATTAALKFSGELEQNLGGSEAVFGEFADSIQKKADEAYKNMGLSASDYLATANKMGALFKGAGFEIKEAADISSKAMQRAADVASIMGIDVSMAMESVAGAAKGNFTMMDNLGVAMNDTTLNAYALEKGLSKTTKQMTTQEKVALAMEMFLDRTAYAAGNYAKENETLAGALTTAGSALKNFMSGASDADAVIESLTNAEKVILKNMKQLLPKLMDGFSDIASLLGDFLADAVVAIAEYAPEFAESAADIISSLLNGINKNADKIAGAAVKIVQTLANAIISNIPLILDTAGKLISAFATALGDAVPILKPVTEIIKALGSSFEVLTPAILGAVAGYKLYTTATSLATTAQTAFNIAASANPIGLVAAGIGAAVTMVGGYLTAKREMTEEEKAHTEAIQSNIDALNELKTASAEQVESIETEMSVTQNLADELKGIVEENGRIKEGYEGRASVITNELNTALGTEMTIIDGIIQKYREEMTAIDELIAKKRAEAIMEAEKALYTEAVTKYNEALAEQARIEGEITKLEAERKDASMLRTSEIDAELEALEGQLTKNKGLVDEYTATISAYDANLEAMAQGAYDNIKSISDATAKEINKADTQKAAESALNKAIDVYKQGLASCKREGVEMSASMKSSLANNIRDAYEKIAELGGELPEEIKTSIDNGKVNVTNSVDELLGIVDSKIESGSLVIGKGGLLMTGALAKQLSDGSAKVKTAVNTVVSDTADVDVSEPMSTIGTNMLTGWAGSVTKNGYLVTDAVTGVANNAVAAAQVTLKINSPSKVFRDKIGKSIPEGLATGISANTSLVGKSVSKLSNGIIDTAKDELDINSPSKRARDEIGKMLTKGIAVGIDDGKTEVQKVMEELAEKPLTEAEKVYKEKYDEITTKRKQQEKERSEQEYQERLKNAKTAAEKEKIKQDRILELEKEADDEYLKELKEKAEKENKIRAAELKDIENHKQAILDSYDDLVEKITDDIAKIEDQQNDMSDKLKDNGELFSVITETFTSDGYYDGNGEWVERKEEKTHKYGKLSDFSEDIAENNRYFEAFEAAEARIVTGSDGNELKLPPGLLDEIRGMSVEEGTMYAEALVNASDEEFRAHIEGWNTKQAQAEEIGIGFYDDETKAIVDAFSEAFGTDVPADFFKIGKETAEKFGEGFMEQLGAVLAESKDTIIGLLMSMMPGGASVGSTTVNNDSTYNYYFQPSAGESTQKQIQSVEDYNVKNNILRNN